MIDDIEHGTARGYDRCRRRPGMAACGPCRAAHADYVRKGNERRHKRLLADPTIVPHGRATTYNNWLCKCPPCTTAATEASTRAKRKRTAKAATGGPPGTRRDPMRAARRTFRAEPIGREWLETERAAVS